MACVWAVRLSIVLSVLGLVAPPGQAVEEQPASDLGPATGAIQVVDSSDPTRPKALGELPLTTGVDSHDITFSADGTRARSAAINHTLIIDGTSTSTTPTRGRPKP